MKTQFIACAFINAEQPLRISDWEGFRVVETHDKRGSLSLGGSRDYFYKHPDAPEHAVLQVYRGEHIMTVEPGDKDFPVIYMLLQAQKAVEQLIRTTN